MGSEASALPISCMGLRDPPDATKDICPKKALQLTWDSSAALRSLMTSPLGGIHLGGWILNLFNLSCYPTEVLINGGQADRFGKKCV